MPTNCYQIVLLFVLFLCAASFFIMLPSNADRPNPFDVDCTTKWPSVKLPRTVSIKSEVTKNMYVGKNSISNVLTTKTIERSTKHDAQVQCNLIHQKKIPNTPKENIRNSKVQLPKKSSNSTCSLTKYDAQSQTTDIVDKKNMRKQVYHSVHILSTSNSNTSMYCQYLNKDSTSSTKIPINNKSKLASRYGIKISPLISAGTNTQDKCVTFLKAAKAKLMQSHKNSIKVNKTTQFPPVMYRSRACLVNSKKEHGSQFPEDHILEMEDVEKVTHDMTVIVNSVQKHKTYAHLQDKSEHTQLNKFDGLVAIKKPEKSKIPKLTAKYSGKMHIQEALQEKKCVTTKVQLCKGGNPIDWNICEDKVQSVPRDSYFKSRLLACPSYSYLPIPYPTHKSGDSFTIPPDYEGSDINFECDMDILFNNRLSVNRIYKQFNVQGTNQPPQNLEQCPPVHIGVEIPYMGPAANSCPILPNRFVIKKPSTPLDYQEATPIEQSCWEGKRVDFVHPCLITKSENQIIKNVSITSTNVTDGNLRSKFNSKQDEYHLKSQYRTSSSLGNCIHLNEINSRELWALTKIIVHRDGSRDFEIIDASPSPPGHFIMPSTNNFILFPNQTYQHSR